MSNDDVPPPPVLRIVHGGMPTTEELAALTVAVQQVAGRAGGDGDAASSGKRWPPRAEAMRGPLPRGAGGWVHSGRPGR